MIGLMPAEVDSIDRERRVARVRIPGLTNGATELPEAEIGYPLGDKSEHTEIRILPGDRVWLAFEGGDTRYPVIVLYRPRNQNNGIDWRRFHHQNFQFDADSNFVITTGNHVIVKAGGNVDVQATGNVNVAAIGPATLTSEDVVTVRAPAIRMEG